MKKISKILTVGLFILAGLADVVITVWNLQAIFDSADTSIVNLLFRLFLLTVIVCALFFGGIGIDSVLTGGENFSEIKESVFENSWWAIVALTPLGTHLLFGALALIFKVFSLIINIF